MNISATTRAKLVTLIVQALTGLKNQNWQKSYDEAKGSCMYRGPNNTRCFIGQIIPDRIASKEGFGEVNTSSFGGLMDAYPELWKDWFPKLAPDAHELDDITDLFYGLQEVHDAPGAPTMKERYLVALKDWELLTPEMEAVLA